MPTDTPNTQAHWIACLCAAWCTTCREWQPLVNEWAHTPAGLRVVWVDIEDEAELLDGLGLDIETFPTLLLAQGDQALFLGPAVPRLSSLDRLVSGLGQATPALVDGAAHGLASSLWQRSAPS